MVILDRNTQRDPFACLLSMPDGLKSELKADQKKSAEYVALWRDCLGYINEYDSILRSTGFGNKFFQEMFKSASKELLATISLILEGAPNPKAAEAARLGTEMFLKSFLILKGGYNDKRTRRLGHDLGAILEECRSISDCSDFTFLRSVIGRFPGINARYKGEEISPKGIWEAYIIVQCAASAIVRLLSPCAGDDSINALYIYNNGVMRRVDANAGNNESS